ERAAVACGHPAVGTECGFERGYTLHRHALARPVVGGDDRPVGRGDRSDLPLPEPVRDRALGEVLAAYPELVHVLATDAVELRELLGALPHRELLAGNLTVLARVVPVRRAALGALRGPAAGTLEDLVGPAPADQLLSLLG